jgi:hypothetical protein
MDFQHKNLLYGLTAEVFPERWKNRMQTRHIDPEWYAECN